MEGNYVVDVACPSCPAAVPLIPPHPFLPSLPPCLLPCLIAFLPLRFLLPDYRPEWLMPDSSFSSINTFHLPTVQH